MKRIINRRLYSTDTATEVASDGNYYDDDMEWWCETLYLKKTGEWFLHGEGGPCCPDSEYFSTNPYDGGAEIEPLTQDQAKDWLAEHDFADEYIKYFGEPEE